MIRKFHDEPTDMSTAAHRLVGAPRAVTAPRAAASPRPSTMTIQYAYFPPLLLFDVLLGARCPHAGVLQPHAPLLAR
jgi:hypothetical protein